MTDIKPTTAVLQALHMLYTIYRMDSADSDRIAAETNLDRRTVTGTINLAVTKGLVLRTERKIGTKRAYYYSITAKGREALAKDTSPSTTAAQTTAAPDKPGVSESETTPEAAIAHLSPFQGEGAARHENAPDEAVGAAESGVDGSAALIAELKNQYEELFSKWCQDEIELGKIDLLAREYVPTNFAKGLDAVKIMGQAIDALHASLKQDADTELALVVANQKLAKLQEALAWHETELASTKSELSAALRVIDDFAQAPTTEAAYDGPFIIAAGWREAEASQKAYDIARDMAMTSAGGVDYGHVPASQPAAAA